MTLGDGEPEAPERGPWDDLIQELNALRRSVGDPSYNTISRRVTEQRLAAGASEHAARIATSSAHYAFRKGRQRINLDLTRELVSALGEDPALVDRWMAADKAIEIGEETTEVSAEPVAPTSRRAIVALLLACLTANLLGREFVDFFSLPIYLDMAGTAIAAIALGPWRGAAVGLSTNLIGVIGSGWVSLPFALVNITGALLWGYGVGRWGMGRTLPRFFGLNVLTAVACSVVALPVIAVFLNRDLRVGHDVITTLVGDSIEFFPAALGFSNLLTSMSDKLVSGFIALVVVSALPLALRRGVDLVAVDSSK